MARARELAKRIEAPLAIVDKRREKAGEIAEMTVIGEVEGKICIIVDDMCDTAGTMCKAAEVLMENGAREVHAYTTHGVMSGPAVERITGSVLKSMVITDTIQPTEAVKATPNIRIIPTAQIFPFAESAKCSAARSIGTASSHRATKRPSGFIGVPMSSTSKSRLYVMRLSSIVRT